MKKVLIIFVMLLLVTSCGKVSSSSDSNDKSSSEKNSNIKTLTCYYETDYEEYIEELEDYTDCILGDKKTFEYDVEKKEYTKILSERYFIYKDLDEKDLKSSYDEANDICNSLEEDESDNIIKKCYTKKDGKKISIIAEVNPKEYLNQEEIDGNSSLEELKSKFENEYSEDIDGSYKCSIE